MDERKEHGNVCGGGQCQHCRSGARGGMWDCGGMHKFFLLRIFILLAMISFVFWSGVKLGELKSSFCGGRSHIKYDDYDRYSRQRAPYDNGLAPDGY